MQFILGGAAASCSPSAPRALAAVVANSLLAIAAGAGDTPASVYTGAAGTPAAYGGAVVRTGSVCDALQLTVTYLVGDDCVDGCDPTPDVLTTATRTITIPAGVQGVTLPPEYIVSVGALVVDGGGVAKTATAAMDVHFTSSRAGLCDEILVP